MAGSRTRWLSADEQSAWRMFLAACQALFSAVDSQLLHDSAIPHGYYEILVRLSEAPGHALRMSQLAQASISSKSRLSHAVARLEERGWVRRLSCPTDRRGQIAQLTEAGLAALTAAAPGHVAQVRRSLIDVLSPEQLDQLRQISATIVSGGEAGCAGDRRPGDHSGGDRPLCGYSVKSAGSAQRARPVGCPLTDAADLDPLSSREPHARTAHRALRHPDVAFLWRLLREIPAAGPSHEPGPRG